MVVPYNVTFDHSQAAKQVYERFHTCLDTILTYGLPQANLSPAQLVDLPLFSVGHRYALYMVLNCDCSYVANCYIVVECGRVIAIATLLQRPLKLLYCDWNCAFCNLEPLGCCFV